MTNSNALPVLLAILIVLAILLSIVAIRRNRRARLLDAEIQAVSAERNDLDQKIRGLLRKPRSSGHQVQHSTYQPRLWPKPHHHRPSRRPMPGPEGARLIMVLSDKPSPHMERLRVHCPANGRHPYAVGMVHIGTKRDHKYGFQYLYACPVDNHREGWIVGYDGKPFRLFRK